MTRRIERAGRAATRALLAHPWAVLAAFLFCAGALGRHAPSMKVDASAETLLTKDNEHYIRTQLVNRRYGSSEFLIIAYRPKDGSIFSARSRADVGGIARRLRGFERVASVRTFLDVPLFSRIPKGLALIEAPSEWTAGERDFTPAELREAFSGHPLYEELLVNEAQTAASLYVTFKEDPRLARLHDDTVDLQKLRLDGKLSGEQSEELARLKAEAEPLERRLDETRERELSEIRAILKEHEDRADTYVGGVHVLGAQLIRIIKNDLVVFGAAVAGAIVVLLLLLFRRARWVAAPMLCAGLSILPTMGLFGLLELKTTVVSSSFISLQLVLTLALVIHLIVQYREYAREKPDWPQEKLLEETLARKAAPCLYAALTTSVGFGSLVFSGIQPVIAFGWMMIIAMAFSTCVSLILFPAMMALLEREPPPRAGAAVRRVLESAARAVIGHPALIGAAGAALLAAGTAGAFLLNVENSFIDYFRARTQAHRELAFIDREFGGTTPFDLVYDPPPSRRGADLVLTASEVQTAQRVSRALSRREGVGKVLSVAEFAEVAAAANDGRPLTEYELTALYRTLDESLREELIGSFLSPKTGQLRFSVRVQDATPGLDRAALLAGVREDMGKLGVVPESYTLTGLFVLYQDFLRRLFRSQLLSLGLVYAAMGLLFLLIFRSPAIALIALAPNVLTTAGVLGTMGWLGIPLDIMTITIAAIAMGISVDDTIHYVHRYLEELGRGGPEEAVALSHASVGYAMLYTTLVITCAFSLLTFSDFVPSVLFGLLTGLAMVLALLTDLTVLPALLAAFVKSPASPAGRSGSPDRRTGR